MLEFKIDFKKISKLHSMFGDTLIFFFLNYLTINNFIDVWVYTRLVVLSKFHPIDSVVEQVLWLVPIRSNFQGNQNEQAIFS